MKYMGAEVNTRQSSKNWTIPAPVGGLNGRDSLASMDPKDAYEMDNVFPETGRCRVRPGCSIHQDPLGAPVTSLEVYASNTQTMIAFAGDKAIDVTVSGVTTVLRNDLVSVSVVSTMFSTVADHAQFLIITTGDDVPMSFNGVAMTDLAITGLLESDSQINYVRQYMGRLFFGTKGKLGFYFLTVPGAIQGAAEWFDLGQLSNLGGYLQAIATFSQDAGDGPNDYIVFITNRGEYLVFQGIDPGDANAWTIVGRYRGPEPIGRKCVANYAGDLLIITTEGVHQFSQIRALADTRLEATALSSKLGDILLRSNKYRDNPGWAMQLWPAGGMMVVNVPESGNVSGHYSQFAMNTVTQEWGRFRSPEWDAICWCMSNKELYFGRYDGSVRKVGTGADNDKPINISVKQAYNYLNEQGYKHFKWAQFLVKSDAPVQLTSKLSVDYQEDAAPSAPATTSSGFGAKWDEAYWDIAEWGSGLYTQRFMAPYGNYGVVASHWLVGSFFNSEFEWYATEHVYEPAQGLL